MTNGFPEAARILTLQGAEIIFYPTAIGYIKGHKSPMVTGMMLGKLFSGDTP
jgi:predicted amidohydrolase